MQLWCVASGHFHRAVRVKHQYDPAHAHRMKLRAAAAAEQAGGAELRALLDRATAAQLTSSEQLQGDPVELAAQAAQAQVAASAQLAHAASHKAQLLDGEAEAEPDLHTATHKGTFRLPTEVTLSLGDGWQPLCASLQRWIQQIDDQPL